MKSMFSFFGGTAENKKIAFFSDKKTACTIMEFYM